MSEGVKRNPVRTSTNTAVQNTYMKAPKRTKPLRTYKQNDHPIMRAVFPEVSDMPTSVDVAELTKCQFYVKVGVVHHLRIKPIEPGSNTYGMYERPVPNYPRFSDMDTWTFEEDMTDEELREHRMLSRVS